VKASVIGVSVVTALTLLAGCSSANSDVASGDAEALVDGCAPSGSAVENVEVSTDLDEAPDIDFSGRLNVSSTERLVVVEGDGEAVGDTDRVIISFAIYNGSSGDLIGHVGYGDEDPDWFPVDASSPSLEGISYTLLCTPVGSRVVGVIPAGQAYGDEGMPEYGLEAGAPVIFVADVKTILPPPEPPLAALTGVIKDAPENFPTVTYQMSGEPTVTLDTSDVPRDYQMTRVIDGTGQEVYPGARVVVHYQGTNMNTGEVFDSSWARGEPASFPTSGIIPGFRDGLVGQNVGSRMLIIIPPALGYGPSGGTIDGSIGPDDTIFFVVDILGVL